MKTTASRKGIKRVKKRFANNNGSGGRRRSRERAIYTCAYPRAAGAGTYGEKMRLGVAQPSDDNLSTSIELFQFDTNVSIPCSLHLECMAAVPVRVLKCRRRRRVLNWSFVERRTVGERKTKSLTLQPLTSHKTIARHTRRGGGRAGRKEEIVFI